MERFLAGILEIEGTEDKFYTEDYINFYTENDDVFTINSGVNPNPINYWVYCLLHPLSITDEDYTVELNYKNAYTTIPDDVPQYRCIYFVEAYECISGQLYAYGDTPQAALQKCIETFEMLKAKYNEIEPDDDEED